MPAGRQPGPAPVPVPAAPTPPAAAWGPVVLGGGGAVPGIIVHPAVPDLAYIRTDVGGAYRWDEAGSRWIPLLDHIRPERWNLYGVESLAVDPGDRRGGTVAVALGKYADSWARPQRGRIAVSSDRGATWHEAGPVLAIAANRQQSRGERLAFDRVHPGRLWYASMADGLWRGDGDDWRRIGLPGDAAALSLIAVHGDDRGETLWTGTAEHGFLRSLDGGTTWREVPGPASRPHRATTDRDGHLLVAHAGGAHRYDGVSWIAITPAGAAGIQTVVADPADPSHLFAAEKKTHQARIFESRDRGASWTAFAPVPRRTRAWWPAWHWVSSPFALACDPHHPGRLWLSDWYAAYRCEDTAAPTPALVNLTDGLEEVVCLALCAPAQGPNVLLSGVADNGGFDHPRIDQAPAATIWSTGGPKGLTCTGVDACPTRPVAVRVGILGGDRSGPSAGSWSDDGGSTWRPFAAVPGSAPASGRIAVSADGEALVWAMHGGQGVFASHDHGATWRPAAQDVASAPGKGGVWNWSQPLCADRVEARTFYLLAADRVWRSGDGGLAWEPAAAAASDGVRSIAAHPSRAGALWLALGGKGLSCSTDGGRTVTPLPAMAAAELVAVGPGRDPDHPLVHVLGTAAGRTGLFVSRDLGRTVEPVEPAGQAFGNQVNTLAADQRDPGRCFVGTNGRGIMWYRVAP